ncbi:hypothetical protein [Clostridium psychrophilum]|uniref:hypothetical protein n=1 Tax=Clostridium psychrophilum TaxID=132926 RepID=UPI001C0A9CCF|nr:hypothetical protein [Clostridium psychrophilum]MBU3182863.1 hypothetical protein [Clostridium psychrophilum]
MLIYYPPYYIVPVTPFIPLNEVNNSINYNKICNSSYIDEYNSKCAEENELYNSYRSINEDAFYDVDEEYINKSLKQYDI